MSGLKQYVLSFTAFSNCRKEYTLLLHDLLPTKTEDSFLIEVNPWNIYNAHITLSETASKVQSTTSCIYNNMTDKLVKHTDVLETEITSQSNYVEGAYEDINEGIVYFISDVHDKLINATYSSKYGDIISNEESISKVLGEILEQEYYTSYVRADLDINEIADKVGNNIGEVLALEKVFNSNVVYGLNTLSDIADKIINYIDGDISALDRMLVLQYGRDIAATIKADYIKRVVSENGLDLDKCRILKEVYYADKSDADYSNIVRYRSYGSPCDSFDDGKLDSKIKYSSYTDNLSKARIGQIMYGMTSDHDDGKVVIDGGGYSNSGLKSTSGGTLLYADISEQQEVSIENPIQYGENIGTEGVHNTAKGNSPTTLSIHELTDRETVIFNTTNSMFTEKGLDITCIAYDSSTMTDEMKDTSPILLDNASYDKEYEVDVTSFVERKEKDYHVPTLLDTGIGGGTPTNIETEVYSTVGFNYSDEDIVIDSSLVGAGHTMQYTELNIGSSATDINTDKAVHIDKHLYADNVLENEAVVDSTDEFLIYLDNDALIDFPVSPSLSYGNEVYLQNIVTTSNDCIPEIVHVEEIDNAINNIETDVIVEGIDSVNYDGAEKDILVQQLSLFRQDSKQDNTYVYSTDKATRDTSLDTEDSSLSIGLTKEVAYEVKVHDSDTSLLRSDDVETVISEVDKSSYRESFVESVVNEVDLFDIDRDSEVAIYKQVAANIIDNLISMVIYNTDTSTDVSSKDAELHADDFATTSKDSEVSNLDWSIVGEYSKEKDAETVWFEYADKSKKPTDTEACGFDLTVDGQSTETVELPITNIFSINDNKQTDLLDNDLAIKEPYTLDINHDEESTKVVDTSLVIEDGGESLKEVGGTLVIEDDSPIDKHSYTSMFIGEDEEYDKDGGTLVIEADEESDKSMYTEMSMDEEEEPDKSATYTADILDESESDRHHDTLMDIVDEDTSNTIKHLTMDILDEDIVDSFESLTMDIVDDEEAVDSTENNLVIDEYNVAEDSTEHDLQLPSIEDDTPEGLPPVDPPWEESQPKSKIWLIQGKQYPAWNNWNNKKTR